MRRKTVPPLLRPVHVPPELGAREKRAMRAFAHAAFGDPRHAPAPGTFDPLWLRMGLRAHLLDARAGWVVSNPLYDEDLRRNPQHDPSLPGPGWLHEVYRFRRYRALVMLPGLRAILDARPAGVIQDRARKPVPAAQAELFGEPA